MITVLESQHVSKRAPSSVTLRAQTPTVHWKNQDARSLRHAKPAWKPKRRRRPSPAPFSTERIEHGFLQGQLIKRKQRRATRKALKTLLRTKDALAGRAAARRLARQSVSRQAPRTPAPDRAAPHALRAAGAAAARVLGSPWLLIGICALAALLVAASAVIPGAIASLAVTGFPTARPVLPAPPEIDPVLYGLMVPEPEAKSADAVSPVLLSSLKVTRYTTRAGDTLSKVAARFKLNVDTVVSWNDIRDAHGLRAGMTLGIPNTNGLKYVVRRGDTLQGIAQARGVDFNGILDANMLASSVITVGQELFLPGARMAPTELNKILGSLFIQPVQGRYSSFYGMRPDPFTGILSHHNGIDIAGPTGTPILAAMAGRVAMAGFNYTFGYYVIIQHSGGYQTMYGHLTRYTVSRGQRVAQGAKIGELGTTGYSTGPHLHFAVFVNGKPVDPLRFLK